MAITTATQAAQIVNNTLTACGYDFQIDTTSGDTIEAGFKAVGAYSDDQKNELLKQMNAILVFRNYGCMFNESKNPTRRFWRDDMNYGGGIEDIFHEIISPITITNNGNYWASDHADLSSADENTLASNIARDLCKYYTEDVKKKFHTTIDSFTIPLSLTELEISKIFTPEGMASYIDVKMANIQWSAEVALLNICIDEVKNMVTDQKIKFKTGYDLSTQLGIANFVEDVQTVTDGMQNISNAFNYSAVKTMSDSEDLYFLTTPELYNRMAVQGYANAYNLNEFALKNKVIKLPYGADMGTKDGKKVLGVVVDRRAIVLSLRYWKMRTFLPANTDYNNYFLKVQYLHGYNEFFNAVAFTGENL